jgi:transposase
MERIAMSQKERDDLDWLRRVQAGTITQREAAEKMGVSDRWVRTLLERLNKQGDAIVVHGLRGRPSNRKLSDETRRQALAIVKQPDWHDFGPTFAAEQLGKRHRIQVGKETLRGWMIEAGLWKPKSRRLEEAHFWRPRRSAFGELVQWDTSEHDWLEGRGPVRYLVRMIDDATSWSWGRFVERDATPHNMGVLWEYQDKNGRMVDVYTDRDSMFAVPPRAGESADDQRHPTYGRFTEKVAARTVPSTRPPRTAPASPPHLSDASSARAVPGTTIVTAANTAPLSSSHRVPSRSARTIGPHAPPTGRRGYSLR